MRRSPRFDALFIDFYGTIAAGDRAAVEAAAARVVDAFAVPLTAPQFAIRWGERFFSIIGRSNHRSFQTMHHCVLLSLQEALREFAGEIDPIPFVVDLEAYWQAPRLHDDARDLLASLDVPVCCVSNADTAPLLAAIESHDLHFDAVVTSEDVRCYKPDPAIFRCALEQLGVNPARTLHAGDSLHSDVGGAAKLGITTAWLCREDRCHDIGTVSADYTISSLTQLAELMSR